MSHAKPHTWIDLIPLRLVCPLTDKASWFVDEHDERGNHYESYEFKTQKQAEFFIELWAQVGEDAAVKFRHCLNRSK
jgi:hypothetical protein